MLVSMKGNLPSIGEALKPIPITPLPCARDITSILNLPLLPILPRKFQDQIYWTPFLSSYCYQ